MRLRTLIGALLLLGCARQAPGGALDEDQLTFVHQPLWGDPSAFEALLDDFRRAHPGVTLTTHLVPNASDVAHQYFLTALEGGSTDFDVLVLDVVWVPEFAHAGWIADLSRPFPPETIRSDFLPGPADVVTFDGRTWAVPWYVDVGLLYRRTDLVPRAPTTPDELVRLARAAQAKDASLAGFVWQGRQYEGLVCNAWEALWAHGGRSDVGGRLVLDTPEFRAGLAWLRGLVTSGISPPSVTSAAEEESRRVFQAGRAAFMRNWPYAWAELQREGSPVRGKVAVDPLPGGGALGGWQLAINAHVSARRRALAAALVRHLTSPDAERVLALSYGRNPARRETYRDPQVLDGVPFIASLEAAALSAKPRPVTPYYNLLGDTLQAELSAAVVGVRSPDEALARAQARGEALLETAR
jgi:multiple sugar transport system substrate-binding protein